MSFETNKKTVTKMQIIDGLMKGEMELVQYGFQITEESKEILCSHFPRMKFLESTTVQKEPQWQLKSEEQILEVLRALNLDCSKRIIICNECMDTLFLYPSCKCAILLLQSGVQQVQILTEGVKGLLEQTSQNLQLINIRNCSIIKMAPFQKFNRKIIMSKQQVERALDDPDFVIIDTRSQLEHEGLISGYSYFHRKGRIQKSIYPWPTDSHLKFTPDIIHQKMATGQFMELWNQNLLASNKNMVLYCGNGWRASESWVFLQLYGMKNVYVYSNGFMEWSRL